jgi:hypothetical protein
MRKVKIISISGIIKNENTGGNKNIKTFNFIAEIRARVPTFFVHAARPALTK